jgi:PAS domain S-box-containing protein
MESIEEAIWAVDAQGRLLMGNATFFTRFRSVTRMDVAVGADLPALVRPRFPELAEHWTRVYARAAAGERVSEEQSFFVEGEERSFALSVTPLMEDGKPIGVVCYSKEVTGWKRVQDNLRQSEERFSTIFHASPVPIFVTTQREGRVVDVNEACAQLAGYSREELIGRTTFELGMWTDTSDQSHLLEELLRRGVVHNHELALRRKTGELVRLVTSFSRIILGGEACLLSTAFDVTEKRRLQQRLRESNDRFARLFQISPAPILVTKMPEGRILDINQACLELFECTRDDVIGRTTLELGLWPKPEERERAVKRLLDHGDLGDVEVAFRSLRGSSRQVGICSTLTELDGQCCAVSILEDVTERNRLLEELTRAKERSARLFEVSPVALILTRFPTGELLSLNEAAKRIYGLSEDALGKTFVQMGIWPSEEERQRFLQALLPTGRVQAFETEYLAPGGEPRRKVLSSTRIELDGQPCLLTVSEDVTAQRALEERLRQATRMEAIGQLAGGVAHDFNNLLLVIDGYGEMLRRELDGSPHPLRLLEHIQRASRRAAELTRQLLAFGRKQVMQATPLDLNAAVREVASLVRRVIGEDIELALELVPRSGTVKVDPGQLEQVLLNLAVNARDAMPDGGRLTLSTANVELGPRALRGEVPPGSYVMLTVSDTGVGMDEATRKRIFEPFFTTKEPGKGTGLGLSSVYGIVRQSGGYIQVESTPGEGATFLIYLPRMDQAAGAGEEEPMAADSRRGTVLLVEDEEEVRELMQVTLESLGYRVLSVSNGADALQVARETRQSIDVLLTDVVMPRMNGPEVAERVRALRPSIRVIYMSGYAGESIARMAELDEHTAFLPKPFAVSALAERLEAAISSNREELSPAP